MRIANIEETSIRNKDVVILERSKKSGLKPIELTIHALSPTYADEAETELPSPQPKFKGFSRDKNGRIEKDRNNKPIKLYEDDDPEYLKKSSEVRQLQSFKMIYDAVDRSKLQFDADPNTTDRTAFYQAIRTEMVEYGFSIGDFATLIEAVSNVSGIDDEDIKAARADFSEPEISPSATSSMKSAND